MSQFSAALFSDALGLLRALFSSPRGRHARRRSTRVRRYAARPGPAVRPLPPAAPRLSAPREAVPADDIPLVRPYYTAHERARVQAAATARLHRWTGSGIPAPRIPGGDLLAPPPATFDDLVRATRARPARRPTAGVGA
ncbi:hypothetical protein ACFVWN_27625 [Nocardiopsis flavescens]|uniref:hypothetical protein n=1 Tax=Nocardiopsis flavescens TaxID=758803 RepID=UPI003652B8EA